MIPHLKTRYQRNINVLDSFKDFSFEDIRPVRILKFETVQKVHKVYSVENFPLYINPSLVFAHKRNGKNELGAIWLVPQLGGFTKNELGMFCEVLYRFLVKNYGDAYQISEDYCVAIDTFLAQKVSYQQLMTGKIPLLINLTLNEINHLK
ncbi:MAG: hypothetical protein EOO96_26810 [Pedobacter sp.]|nr:MAG: hypothetical protein EOO96_26810 [Pedobacter sp.]